MFDALYVAASGMRGQQLQIDTIAHNLANLNTIGFRRTVASFSEVSALLAESAAAESGDSQASSVTAGARRAGVSSSLSLSSVAGELKATGEPLDVAIDGLGFMEVVRSDGTPAYTRAGKLRINEERLLTALDGSPLSARIEIPADARSISILPDGRVVAAVGDSDDAVELGNIELAAFPNPSALTAAGANLYVAPPAAGEPQIAAPGELGMGLLRQGFVESSNVQLADELVTMMLAQRAFELNARVVQAADQLLSITNSLYR
jgi:flagellar basal-body rod protein FlgG